MIEIDDYKPTIKVDKYAIRFIYNDGGVNLFWADLFYKSPGKWEGFHNQLMVNIKKIYDDCIINNIEPEEENEDGGMAEQVDASAICRYYKVYKGNAAVTPYKVQILIATVF